MDTNNAAVATAETATTVEPMSNGEIVSQIVRKVSCFARTIETKGVRESRTFVAINDCPATALENISFGAATTIIRTADKLFGVEAVDVVVSSILGCKAEIVIEDEYVTNIVVNAEVAAAKDALLFYKELNA